MSCGWRFYHIPSTCRVSLPCVFSGGWWGEHAGWSLSHSHHTCRVSLPCGSAADGEVGTLAEGFLPHWWYCRVSPPVCILWCAMRDETCLNSCRTLHIHKTSLWHGCFGVQWGMGTSWTSSHIPYTYKASLRGIFSQKFTPGLKGLSSSYMNVLLSDWVSNLHN